ncbi:hypothetical protein EDB84DRAFT_41975 [Lactarius hengduanensis]|nr:hypothetical protein EDB84DRAFT_41975 [Lactarius hengduanensis]
MNARKSNLFPILPSTIRDSRYRDIVRVRVSPTIIPLGANLVSAPSYQSQGWTVSSHPEGKRYAHGKAQAGITLVTEAHITEPGVLDQLNAWLAIICDIITEGNVHLLETSHLFLEIHQDSGTCNYYFADHGLRTIFWLHTLDTTSVGLPHSYSSDHLQHSLEENYWIHVELFPKTASQYSAIALNELLAIFLRAHADALTSEIPTFPYTPNQCEDLIELLQRSRDHASNPFVVTYVARLWATIANHRFFIRFGEDHCQLSSDQLILEAPESKSGLIMAVVSKVLLFGIPDHYEAQFTNLWEDQFADTSRWPEYVSETVEDLKQTRSWILALLSASIPTMQMTPFSGLIKASLFLCAFDIAITSFLLQQYQRLLSMNTYNSVSMVAYLKDRNTGYGFQPIAVVHSLPQALFVWALLLFSMQGFWMAFADLPPTSLLLTLVLVAAILTLTCLVIWLVVRQLPEPIEDAMLRTGTPPSDPGAEHNERPTAESMV